MTPHHRASTALADYIIDHIERLPEDMRTQAALLCGELYAASADEHLAALKGLIPRIGNNVVPFPVVQRPIPKVQP